MCESNIYWRILKLLVSAELTVQPVWKPVVIIVHYGGPQEVGDKLGEGGPLNVLDLGIHVAHEGRVLLQVSLDGDVEDVRGVHLVTPVCLLAELELVPEGGDQTIKRMTDECETEGGVEQSTKILIFFWTKFLRRHVEIFISHLNVAFLKEYFVPRR